MRATDLRFHAKRLTTDTDLISCSLSHCHQPFRNALVAANKWDPDCFIRLLVLMSQFWPNGLVSLPPSHGQS